MYDKYLHRLYNEKNKEVTVFDGIQLPLESLEKIYRENEETVRKPDLYGKTVRVTKLQFPRIYNMVSDIATSLNIDVPEVFIYEGYYYEIKTCGVGRYWLEITASTIRDLTADELKFCLARELYQIKMGMVKTEQLIQEALKMIPSQIPDSLINLFNIKFSQWSRLVCYSSDNYALAYVKNIKVATTCILMFILNNRSLVEEVNIFEYLKSCDEIDRTNDPMSLYTKNDEMLPYGQYRIKNLIANYSKDAGAGV